MPHTNTFLIADHDEAAFCSGHGSTENTPTELVAADLTALDKLLSFTSGLVKPEREKIFHLASGLLPSDVITHGYVSKGGSLQALFQTSKLYDWAVSPTIGTKGTSKAFRCYSPYRATEYDLYGCQCKKWELELNVKKATMQNVDFSVAQNKTTSITPIVGGIPAASTATIYTWKDPTITIDSQTIAQAGLKSLKFTIENTFDEDDAWQLASAYIANPALLERNISFEVEFLKNNSQTWDEDELNATVQTIAASLNLGLFTLTLANFNLWETNQEELEQRGIVRRSATFDAGVGATYVKS